jgi:hypothetical protein
MSGMDVSFSGLLSYIEERAEKLLKSGEYTKVTGHLKGYRLGNFSPFFLSTGICLQFTNFYLLCTR